MALQSTFRIARRNLGRNLRRTILAVTAIAVGQLAFLGVSALMHGYANQYFDSITGPFVGHIQIHQPDWRDERSVDLTIHNATEVLEIVRAHDDVRNASARIYAPSLVAVEHDGFMGMVMGIDPRDESHDDGLLSGLKQTHPLGERRVVVGRIFADKNGIEKGMELALVGQDIDGSIANNLFTVTDVINSPVAMVNTMGIVMSLEDARDYLRMDDDANEIIIHLEDKEMASPVAADLLSDPILAHLEILGWRDLVPHLLTMIEFVDVYKFIVLFIVCIAAIAGIANTMMMSMFERIHEFGMLLSLGCNPGRLARLILIEASLLALIGLIIGSGIGIGLVTLTSDQGIDYARMGGNESSFEVAFQGLQMSSHVYPNLTTSDILIGIAAILLTAIIATIWPILHVIHLEPVEVMRS